MKKTLLIAVTLGLGVFLHAQQVEQKTSAGIGATSVQVLTIDAGAGSILSQASPDINTPVSQPALEQAREAEGAGAQHSVQQANPAIAPPKGELIPSSDK